MDRKHLLWWIFKHLSEKHPDVLAEMLTLKGEFGGNATDNVAGQMQEAFARYEKSLETEP